MSTLSKVSRALALALVLAPVVSQPVQAATSVGKYAAIYWDIKKYPGIQCITVRNIPDVTGTVRGFNVDPLHGFLTTRYKLRIEFELRLFKSPNCGLLNEKKAVAYQKFSMDKSSPNHVNIYLGDKYVYGFF